MKVSKEEFLSDWPEFVVTEETREAAKNNPNITDVRLRTGRFRTDVEEEEHRRLIRETPLPGNEDNSLGHVRKLKVFDKIRENKKIRYTLEGIGSFAFSMAILTPLIIKPDYILPGLIASVIGSSAVALFVLSITESEIIKEKYAPSILKREDSEVEFEKAMQHVRLVNQIEVPMDAKENQKVLKKSK